MSDESPNYRFIGNDSGVHTLIPVLVTEARIETDLQDKPYVIAKIWMSVAGRATEVAMSVEQALEADIIERV